MKYFLSGLATGLTLQLAIGPVFFFIINLSMQSSLWNGLAGALGVTLGDYFYITLAILGVGKLLEEKRVKKVFGAVSSAVLILFGSIIMIQALGSNAIELPAIQSPSILTSFLSVLILTLSSPLTIVLFTSVFASIALAKNYEQNQLYAFGLGTGFATFVFMASSVVVFSLIRGAIPLLLIQILNFAVGALLIGYGGIRLFKSFSVANINRLTD